MSATRKHDSTTRQGVLYMALELSEKTWKLGFSTGLGQEPRQRDIAARAVPLLEEEIRAAKERFGLPPETPVVSCYGGETGTELVVWRPTIAPRTGGSRR